MMRAVKRLFSSRAIARSTLFALCLCGCGGHVDLGGTSVAFSAPPDSVPADERERASGTEIVARIWVPDMLEMTSDGSYLYFNTYTPFSDVGPLWRCRSQDCVRTMVVLREDVSISSEADENHFVWWDSFGIKYCELPDCSNVMPISGPAFELYTAWTFDRDYFYWSLRADSTIYRCQIPDCGGGPEVIAQGVMPSELRLEGDYLYALDEQLGVLRVTLTGEITPQRLLAGEGAEWKNYWGNEAVSEPLILDAVTDGQWLYAVLAPPNCNEINVRKPECATGISLVRWRQFEKDAPRESIVAGDNSIDGFIALYAFGGELAWQTLDGNFWSCLADACALTKRLIGVDVAGWYRKSDVVFDATHIYWLSAQCKDGACSKEWSLKRVRRLAP